MNLEKVLKLFFTIIAVLLFGMVLYLYVLPK